jgi:hypothetical protein
MRHLLDTDLELVVKGGFIYVPLLFDPAIEAEIHTSPKSNSLIELDGRYFVRTLSLHSLVENYEKIHPDSYEHLRSACLEKYGQSTNLAGISINGKLSTILFHVMPHFIRRKKQLDRRRLGEEETLNLIGERINIPAAYYEDATKFLDTNSLRGVLHALEEQRAAIDPPRDGLVSAASCREWLLKALEVKILGMEKRRLRQALEEREQLFVETQRKHIATLLYIAEKGALEIDGFGFSRIGLTDDYLIYKHTGEYALKDFYGRIYLFPDCRVGVSTMVSLKPFVIDAYKHPFLEGHDSAQEICLRHFTPPRVFTAATVINALEEGLNTLLYGYSSRRRNGYHSLDRLTRHARTVDLDDYMMLDHEDYAVIRTRRVRTVDFDDYRVPRDHPKIASGEVAITNNYTP